MKSKTLKQNKVNIITLGCSKNLVDSEMLSGQLVANDIDVVHENKKLDHNIVVINTCGFIDKAKEESVNTILDQVALKNKGKLDKVYVTGCLSERYRRLSCRNTRSRCLVWYHGITFDIESIECRL